MEPVDLLIACVRKLGGENIKLADEPNTVHFSLYEIGAFAYIKPAGRLRGSVFIDPEVPAEAVQEALDWADEQSPQSGRLDVGWVSDSDDDGAMIRLLFERELDPEVIRQDDPLADEADALFRSWWDEGDGAVEPPARVSFQASDPTKKHPTNAWLLMGSEESFPSDELLQGIARDAAVGIYETVWTAAKQTEPGDLLFFYFSAPRKTVQFVARAAGHAYFDDDGPIGATWSGRKWWVPISPMVEVAPIPLAELHQVIGKKVMLGRSGHYVRPEHAAQLADAVRAVRPEDAPLLARILQPVRGRADHPDPATLDLSAWRDVAAGSLRLEADVERLLVEPLLRMTVGDLDDASVARAYRVDGKIVDYVVLRDDRPACAVEVKLRVRKAPTTPWGKCKDFEQAAGYGKLLGAPSILMDAFDIHLIPPGAKEPSLSIKRSAFLHEDLATLRSHTIGT